MKTAVIYWSGTGNTEAMANAVAEGMKEAGAEVTMLTPDQVQAGELGGYGAIAFGCPAMGSEVLEEMDFQPMFDACKNMLGGKRVALFGSFGWGDGQWMRDWESDCSNAGISLTCESVTCCETPDDTALAACREMGKALAGYGSLFQTEKDALRDLGGRPFLHISDARRETSAARSACASCRRPAAPGTGAFVGKYCVNMPRHNAFTRSEYWQFSCR